MIVNCNKEGTSVRLFADDTLIYRVIHSLEDQVALQRDLARLEQWAESWGMVFNASKCHIMHVSRSSSSGISGRKTFKVQRLTFMYKILNGQVAVPAASVDLILSTRPSRGTDANQQKLISVRSYTENYRQSYSIRTVKDGNSLPQSVVSAGALALFKSRLTSHVAPWQHSPSVWCPSQGPYRLIIQIQIQVGVWNKALH